MILDALFKLALGKPREYSAGRILTGLVMDRGTAHNEEKNPHLKKESMERLEKAGEMTARSAQWTCLLGL